MSAMDSSAKPYRENTRILEESRLKEVGANARQEGGSHYMDMAVEPWDVVESWPLEQQVGAYRHGAIKYLMRMGSKDNRLQEIKKAGHYIEKLIEILEQNK